MEALSAHRSHVPQNDFWVFAVCDGRANYFQETGRLFILNFAFTNVPEADLRSGFRLIIVDKTNSDRKLLVSTFMSCLLDDSALNRVMLVDQAEDWYGDLGHPDYDEWGSIPQHLSAQHAVSRPFRAFLASRARSRNSMYPNSLTLVLECALWRETPGTPPTWTLFPSSNSISPRSYHLAEIIFDRMYPPKIKTIGLSLGVLIQNEDSARAHSSWFPKREDFVYLNILRGKGKRPTPILPRTLIFLIAEFALTSHQTFTLEWDTDLRSIGMVCRSWSHIFELRWRALGSEKYTLLQDLSFFYQFRSAARALDRGLKPNEARHINGFNMTKFNQFHPHLPELATAFIRNINSLLYLVINPATFVLAKPYFAKQTHILTFSIRCADTVMTASSIDHCNVTLYDICSVVKSWRHLRKIEIKSGRYDNPHRLEDPDAEPVTSGTASYSCLEEIGFYEGFLLGADLIRILPRSVDKFHTLTLYRTAGLQTDHIATFLSLTHATLARLILAETYIQEGKISHPLDIWISKMKRLVWVKVPGAVASLLSILRRPDVTPESLAPVRFQAIITRSSSNDKSSIEIQYKDASEVIPTTDTDGHICTEYSQNPESLLSAILNQTTWENIYVSFRTASTMDPAQMDAWRGAISVGAEKGIKLTVSGLGR